MHKSKYFMSQWTWK